MPTRGEAYDTRFAQLADRGVHLHGEADLVSHLLAELGVPSNRPAAVLDAGCGTGRVAVELAARGMDVTGIDVDPEMLGVARGKSADAHWILGDLADADLPRSRFDLAVLAGNVMIFVQPGTEGSVLINIASSVRPGGLVVSGFQLAGNRAGSDGPRLDRRRYDALCAEAGLVLVDRWATWDREPFGTQDTGARDYMVSVHHRPVPGHGDKAAEVSAQRHRPGTMSSGSTEPDREVDR